MTNGGRGGGNVVLGLVLVALGVLFLLEQLFGVNVWRFSWPFFVILPGVLFFVGMVLGGRSAGGLAIPGSIVTMTGLILLFQTISNLWQSWAYAWALIFPTALGLGMMIQGAWSGLPRLYRVGSHFVAWGVALFLLGAAFFELVLNLSGFGGGPIAGIVWPSLLIALGLFLLVRRTIGVPLGPMPMPRGEASLEEGPREGGLGGR